MPDVTLSNADVTHTALYLAPWSELPHPSASAAFCEVLAVWLRSLSGLSRMDMPAAFIRSLNPRNDPATYEPHPSPDPYHRHQSFMRHAHSGYHPSHTIYVPPQQLPAPQSHKVWILDCKSCGIFFTNRGMKVGLTFVSFEQL